MTEAMRPDSVLTSHPGFPRWLQRRQCQTVMRVSGTMTNPGVLDVWLLEERSSGSTSQCGKHILKSPSRPPDPPERKPNTLLCLVCNQPTRWFWCMLNLTTPLYGYFPYTLRKGRTKSVSPIGLTLGESTLNEAQGDTSPAFSQTHQSRFLGGHRQYLNNLICKWLTPCPVNYLD